jgi:hypothetical protein
LLQVSVYDSSYSANRGTITRIQSEFNATLITFITPTGSAGISILAFAVPFVNKPILFYEFYFEKAMQPFVSKVMPSSGPPVFPVRLSIYVQVFFPIN